MDPPRWRGMSLDLPCPGTAGGLWSHPDGFSLSLLEVRATVFPFGNHVFLYTIKAKQEYKLDTRLKMKK